MQIELMAVLWNANTHTVSPVLCHVSLNGCDVWVWSDFCAQRHWAAWEKDWIWTTEERLKGRSGPLSAGNDRRLCWSPLRRYSIICSTSQQRETDMSWQRKKRTQTPPTQKKYFQMINLRHLFAAKYTRSIYAHVVFKQADGAVSCGRHSKCYCGKCFHNTVIHRCYCRELETSWWNGSN